MSGKPCIAVALFASAWLGLCAAEAPASTNQLHSLTLVDQNGVTNTLIFPTNKPVVLMVADRKGYPQTESWVQPVKARYSTNVLFLGVADVKGVPGPLKGMVRRRIKAGAAHSLLLDWDGEVSRALPCAPGVANIFVLDSAGWLKRREIGSKADTTLDGVFKAADALLPGPR